METIVIQGEDEAALEERQEQFIKEAKRRNWEVTRIQEDKTELEKLFLTNLYFQKTLFIIENPALFSEKELLSSLKKVEDKDFVLIISSSKKLKAGFLNKIPHLKKTENFDYPQIIFQFLDSLYPPNAKQALLLFHQLLKSEPPELIFHLLSLRLRDLYWTKISPSNLPYPSWRVAKLERQGYRFSPSQLQEIIDYLASIDIEAKRSSLGLEYYLDLFILKYLE